MSGSGMAGGGIRASLTRHPAWWSAAGCAALAVLCAVLDLVGLWSVFTVLPAAVSPWWSLALALPAAALIPLRTKAPWVALALATALWLLDLLTVGGIATLVVLLDVLYGTVLDAAPGERHRVRDALIVTVLLVAAVALLRSGDVRVALLMGLQLGALFGMTYWYATSVAQAGELLALQRARAEDAAAQAQQRQDDAVRDEREAMARELHDLVAGHVSAMAIRAEAALSAPSDAARDRAALRAVRDSSLEAHAALRSMIAVLRAQDGAPAAPLRRDALPALVEDAARTGLRVTLVDAIAEPLPGPVDQAVTRIVQEALANCVRHAAGADVVVELTREHADVRVRVESRGGAPLVQPGLAGSGWGLELLSERARALGGEIQAGPTTEGWSVRASVPLEVVA